MKHSSRLSVFIALTIAVALLVIGIYLQNANDQRLIDEENDRRFGTVSYTLDEAREIVDALIPLPTIGFGK